MAARSSMLSLLMLVVGMLATVAGNLEGGKQKEEEELNLPLYVDCCKADLLLPIIFKSGEEQCKKYLPPRGERVVEPKDDNGCLVECMLEANDMLDGDKSVKEAELRDVLLTGVDPQATDALKAALDKCFMEQKEKAKGSGEKGSTCHRSQSLFGCITTDVLENCPDPFWRTDVAKCTDARPNMKASAADEEHEI